MQCWGLTNKVANAEEKINEFTDKRFENEAHTGKVWKQ